MVAGYSCSSTVGQQTQWLASLSSLATAGKPAFVIVREVNEVLESSLDFFQTQLMKNLIETEKIAFHL